MPNHGLKPTANSWADFVRQSPATGSEVFEGWLPRIVGGGLAQTLVAYTQ